MNIVNKRWRHFHRFAKDMGIKGNKLAEMIEDSNVGDVLKHGSLRLTVQKKVHDKYGKLYTLVLMDESDRVLRRGPVYVRKPNYRRGLSQAIIEQSLIVLAVASVALIAVFLTDLGGIMTINETCSIDSFEVIETGTNTGFMRFVVQNGADRTADTVTLTSPSGMEFCGSGTCLATHPPYTTQKPGVFDDGMRVENVASGDSVLLQAEMDYGNAQVSCTAETKVK